MVRGTVGWEETKKDGRMQERERGRWDAGEREREEDGMIRKERHGRMFIVWYTFVFYSLVPLHGCYTRMFWMRTGLIL